MLNEQRNPAKHTDKGSLSALQPPDLNKRLFWEYDYDRINWQYHYRMVIERVIERGTEKEWNDIVRYYGLDKVLKTLKEEINYLPDYIITSVCRYFNIKPTELKCYMRKQSLPRHWI